jgi:hypothetical protein
MDDSDYLRLLTIQAEQANAFLSNARKWERERWVCQRLLQGLNIPYRSEDFTPAGQEPPDVLFRDAAFEVFFVLDEGRRLNDEWREELQRRRSAFSLSQLVRREAGHGASPPRSCWRAWRRPCAKRRTTTGARAGPGRAGHHRLRQPQARGARPQQPFPPPTEYLRQGWRSLSLVGPTFARVLFAHPDAPDFLRSNLGRSIVFDVGISL